MCGFSSAIRPFAGLFPLESGFLCCVQVLEYSITIRAWASLSSSRMYVV